MQSRQPCQFEIGGGYPESSGESWAPGSSIRLVNTLLILLKRRTLDVVDLSLLTTAW